MALQGIARIVGVKGWVCAPLNLYIENLACSISSMRLYLERAFHEIIRLNEIL